MTNRNPYQNPPNAPPVVASDEECILIHNNDGTTIPIGTVHEQLVTDITTGSSRRVKTTLQIRADDGIPITDPYTVQLYECRYCGKSRLHEQSVMQCAACAQHLCRTCQRPVDDPDAGPIILCPVCEAQTHRKRLVKTFFRWLFTLRW